jgi:hypothetical protein
VTFDPIYDPPRDAEGCRGILIAIGLSVLAAALVVGLVVR